MSRIHRFACLAVFLPLLGFQDMPAYRVFDVEGQATDYASLLATAAEADVVLFGELHNNAMVHWLQRQLTEDLVESGRPLVLGAEMFETDDQLLMNEYLGGLIRAKDFETEVKLWNNYATDYKPLVEIAEQHGLQFIATNVPRRYAALVSRRGIGVLDSLPESAGVLCASAPFPIDYELPGYKAMMEMMSGHGGGMNPRYFVEAQALKDATMAQGILNNVIGGGTFVHYNGTYHSKDFEGIAWYLKQSNPDLNVVTIHSVEQGDVSSLLAEHVGSASFVLAVPENMAKTY